MTAVAVLIPFSGSNEPVVRDLAMPGFNLQYKVNNFSESHFKISLKTNQKKKTVTVQISFLVIINLGPTGYGQRVTCKQVILQLSTCLQV